MTKAGIFVSFRDVSSFRMFCEHATTVRKWRTDTKRNVRFE